MARQYVGEESSFDFRINPPMRHIIYLPTGTTVFNDSEPETPFTHAVIGQRSESHFNPDPDHRPLSEQTEDDKLAIRKHAIDTVAGKFKLKPLTWHSSEESAIASVATYTEPEWENVRVVRVDAVAP